MKDQLHITLEEAMTLSRYTSFDQDDFATDIGRHFLRTNPPEMRILVYGVCFNAGIIEGMRRERARRKAREESAKPEKALEQKSLAGLLD